MFNKPHFIPLLLFAFILLAIFWIWAVDSFSKPKDALSISWTLRSECSDLRGLRPGAVIVFLLLLQNLKKQAGLFPQSGQSVLVVWVLRLRSNFQSCGFRLPAGDFGWATQRCPQCSVLPWVSASHYYNFSLFKRSLTGIEEPHSESRPCTGMCAIIKLSPVPTVKKTAEQRQERSLKTTYLV